MEPSDPDFRSDSRTSTAVTETPVRANVVVPRIVRIPRTTQRQRNRSVNGIRVFG
jgi:hypothetical protein